ncbi:MAG: hypothetical protein M1820_006883 [Bogoriella megaspora]|nr:MAG: hypothetical protein M1820_006883 [Bogoriella megaspora]
MPSRSSSSSLLFPEKPQPSRTSSAGRSHQPDSPRTPVDEITPLMHAVQGKKKPGRKTSLGGRSNSQLTKSEIRINVYDLLPPSRISSILWTFGTSLLHSGVVIGEKEYAFGGHDQPGLSGVYWTRPRLEPPGGTFKLQILHGFSYLPIEDIEGIVREVSAKFQGPSYNLLTNNCNHFTSHLCHRLTSRKAPSWLNRAASIGHALPCLVPREWTDLEPPDHDTASGELLDEEDEHDERSPMMGDEEAQSRRLIAEDDDDESEETERRKKKSASMNNKNRRVSFARDTSGREVPAAERAPMPTIRIN